MLTANSVERSTRPVATWIITGIIMLLIQVVLGGITRLTGSGLSITEWNVVTGTLPPLSQEQWLTEFEKYKQTPQYQILNTGFTLSDFKFIFFWEWFHRFWARLIGVVFVVGFIYLVSKKYLKKEMVQPLIILFLLGALQGAVGWIMVASGLEGDAVYVKPTRLALHFIFALGLISYAVWFALKLRVPESSRVISAPLRAATIFITGFLLVQLIFGALMAGHKAAMAAPTWPDINGYAVPPIETSGGTMRTMLENKILIHFVHRTLAYILVLLIAFYTVSLYRFRTASAFFRKIRILPAVLVVAQLCLGIATVLTSRAIVPNRWGTYEWMAELHQVVGMLLLLSMVMLLYIFEKERSGGQMA